MEPGSSQYDHYKLDESAPALIPLSSEQEVASQAQPRSPRKSQQPRAKAQLQLFNPTHRNELTKLFQGLRRYQLDDDDTEEQEPEADDPVLPTDPDYNTVEQECDEGDRDQQSGLQCTACACTLGTIREQREHYRLDWHRYNVKRKVHGQPPVTEAEFDGIVDGLSSISGSDSSDNEENSSSTSSAVAMAGLMDRIKLETDGKTTETDLARGRREKRLKGSPKAFFENDDGDIVMIYKTVLPAGELPGLPASTSASGPDGNIDLASRFLSGQPPRWAVIMLSGGHFAASIVEGGAELKRKTFHSYTVRAKQGGGQGARDAKSGGSHPKSAGASLRRYNEASFAQHIQELLESWQPDLEKCEWIFYRALSFNEKILFSGKTPPLSKSDPRLKTIPFPTKRPTNSEVKRVIAFLSAVQVFSKEDFLTQFLISPRSKQQQQQQPQSGDSSPTKSKKNTNIDRARSRSPKKRDEPERPPTTSPEDSDPDGTFVIEEMEEEVDLGERLEEFGDSLTAEERHKGQWERGKPKKRRPRRAKLPQPPFEAPKGIYGELLNALMKEDTKEVLSIIDQFWQIEISREEIQEMNQHVNENEATFLHLASQLNQVDAIGKLMEIGCDPARKDKMGKYPYNCAKSKEARLAFRRYRAKYPGRFDYQRAQYLNPSRKNWSDKRPRKRQHSIS